MTVRDAVLGVMRRFGMTRIFGNPGSTEIHFLVDLPDDFEFVLVLHEGSVVGMASGYAIARGEPSFVNLHTAPGLGNAINAIANARDCRAPLVVVVGQQDRRQISFEPFLTGRALDRLAGEYPVWSSLPARAQDVPGAIARAYHEAAAARGPALVVVPMGDWLEEADELAAGAPASVLRPSSVAESDLSDLAELVGSCASPVIVVGAGSDSRPGWDAVVALAERLGCWVWQEPFGGRAGFPQDHPLFAGHLPWMRRRFREKLEGHDCVLAIGTNAFRTYLFDESVALVAPGTRVAVITDDASEAHRSPCDVAVVADVAAACRALAACAPERLVIAGAGAGAEAGSGAGAGGGDEGGGAAMARPAAPPPPSGPGEPLRAGHVLAELAARLPCDTVLVEETPSSRPELHERIPARAPLGFVSNANGALGFGLAGAIGLRMGAPERPVVAVVGDGSAMYAIQSLWSAATYSVGVLFIVMANGGYAVMDQLAAAQGGAGPWPGFGQVDIAGISRCLGCPAVRVETYAELVSQLDEVVPGLAGRDEPLVLEVAVAP
jgi:benzoylformate decarboxylase